MTSYHIESIPDGWAVFDSAGKQYGSAHRRQDAKQLLTIRRHMALAGSAIAAVLS